MIQMFHQTTELQATPKRSAYSFLNTSLISSLPNFHYLIIIKFSNNWIFITRSRARCRVNDSVSEAKVIATLIIDIKYLNICRTLLQLNITMKCYKVNPFSAFQGKALWLHVLYAEMSTSVRKPVTPVSSSLSWGFLLLVFVTLSHP